MQTEWVADHRDRVDAFRRRHRIGLVTLFFSDIVGSTAIKAAVGDIRAVPLIDQHHQTVRGLLARFPEAEEIGTAGDSFFIVFSKPSDAVKFSLLVQRANRSASAGELSLRDRIGIHVGEVFIDDDPAGARSRDLYGLQVDTCARIMSLGGADQILLSRFAFDSARQVLKGDDVASIGNLSWLNHGTYLLKGVDDPIEICEVGERENAALVPPPDSSKGRREVRSGDEPVLGWRPAINQTVPNTEWVLEKSLGEGGFGEVWLGYNRRLKQKRVFKFCFDPDRVRSLKREVTIFRILKENVGAHPNIVSIEDVYFEHPPFYIVVEYVDGPNLRDWWKEQPSGADADLRNRLEVVAQIADALQAAHDSGVIHRDVKPQNILIAHPDGSIRARLTDFGIGKLVTEQALLGITRLGFTQTVGSSESHTGTQMYLAPEILAGQPATTRSDIYSLGVVLYQLIVGDLSRPLTSEWESDIAEPLLREDLRHCFARDPEKRFVAVKQLGDHLRSLEVRRQKLVRDQEIQAAREKAAYQRGVIRTAAIAFAILAVVGALAFVATYQARRAQRARDEVRTSLSWSHYVQALRSIGEGKDLDALAQLARSVSADRTNEPAAFCLINLLTYRNYPLPHRLLKHDDGVTSAEFTDDGRRIVTIDSGGVTRLWDARTGEAVTAPLESQSEAGRPIVSADGKHVVTCADKRFRISDLETHGSLSGSVEGEPIKSATFSSDGKRLFLIAGNSVSAWDVTTAHLLSEPRKYDGESPPIEFTEEGNRVVTFSKDEQTAQVWDAETGKSVSAPIRNKLKTYFISVSADGRRVVTVCAPNRARLWDASTGGVIAELPNATEMVSISLGGGAAAREVATPPCFSPDSRYVATISGDTLQVWNAGDGQPVGPSITCDEPPNDPRFSPDGRRIVALVGNLARVWNTETGQQVTEPLKHNDMIESANFSRDGQQIVTASFDHTIRVWDIGRSRPLAVPMRHDWTVWSAQFSADDSRVVTASEDRTARVWDVTTGKPLTEPMRHDDPVVSAVFSRDGSRLATIAGNPSDTSKNSVAVWDGNTGRRITKPIPGENATFSADGARLLIISNSQKPAANTVTVWDATTGHALGEPMKHEATITSAELSPDATKVVTLSGDNKIRIWNRANEFPLTISLSEGQWLEPPQFSSDGKLVAAVSARHRLAVWDAQTGKSLVGVWPNGLALHASQLTADAKMVVDKGQWSDTARLWDTRTGEPLTELLQHDGHVWSTELSPDGKRVLTTFGRQERRMCIWDAATGKALPGPTSSGSNTSAHFSSSGRQIVVASEDGTARIWDLKPKGTLAPEWLPALAEAVANQQLNDRGFYEPLSKDSAEIIEAIRDKLRNAAATMTGSFGEGGYWPTGRREQSRL